jgi:hypothetical protein
MAVLKRMLPVAVAIAVGLFALISVFIDNQFLDDIGAYFVDTAVIIAAFAFFLGLVNVLRVHARKIRERQAGSVYSLVLIAAMLIVLLFGLPPLDGQPFGPSQPVVQWVFDYIQAPIQASLSALLAFFTITAAYRLLRVRNVESAVMLVAALLVLVGQVSVGLVPVLPDLKDWILAVPTTAGVRGILLGVALGTILTSIRLILGVERPYSD